MDSGLTVRPATASAPPAAVRVDVTPVRESVPTDLAPPQAVAASAKSVEPRNDTTSKIIVDSHSREVIFQVLNADSGRVVRQIPEEATLRLRAYVRAMANGEAPNKAQLAADVDVEA